MAKKTEEETTIEPTLSERMAELLHGKKAVDKDLRVKLRESEIEELRKALEFKPARSVLVRLLVRSQLFHSTYDPDSQQMAYNEGKRRFGIELFADIAEVSPKHRNQVQGEYYDYTSSKSGK